MSLATIGRGGQAARAAPERALARAAWPLLAATFAVAVATRAGHVLALASDPVASVVKGDGQAYLEWADRIRGGAVVGESAFYQDPLYPYLLAAWRALAGESLTALRALHVVLGGLGCALLALAGRALGGARAGRVMGWFAGLTLALHPTSIFLDGLVDKTALVTLLVCAVAARAVTLPAGQCCGGDDDEPMGARAAPSVAAHVGLGALVGLWMLARGEARITAALLALWVAWRAHTGGGRALAVRASAAYVVGVVVAVAPALAHNVAASGEWLLTTAQAGPNFYIGNRAGSTGTYAPLIPGRGDARREGYDARRLAEEAEGRPLTSREVSRYWTRRALDELRQDPVAAAQRFARKARLALSRYEVPDTDDFGASVPRSPVLRALAPLVHMGTLLPLALFGLAAAQRRARFVPIALVAGAQLSALVLFYVFARYRLPLVPCLALFAAEAVARLPAMLRAPGRRLATACTLAALGASAAFWPVPRELDVGDQLDRYHHATALMELGRLGEAERELAAMTADVPGNVEAWTSLGIVRARLQRPAEAVPAFLRARALSPDDPRLAGQLGTALAEAGQLAEAAEVLRAAALADPRHPEVTSNAALLNLQLGRVAAAVEVLRARVAAVDDDRGAALQLAWILATSRDVAVHDGEEAVRLAAPWVAGAGADDPVAFDVYAVALAGAGRFDEALVSSTRAIELLRGAPQGPRDASAQLAALEAHRERFRARLRWVE